MSVASTINTNVSNLNLAQKAGIFVVGSIVAIWLGGTRFGPVVLLIFVAAVVYRLLH